MKIINADCRDAMKNMAAESFDSIVTDPPYGLSFMGKGWDHGVPGVEFWTEALRVAKPGTHLLAFGGTRTYHRLACAIEDAGWEIRDCVMWVYGSGFPKSLDVSKAIDKAAGAEREVVGTNPNYRPNSGAVADPEWFQDRSSGLQTAPATDAARQWSGWGTALKPAWEPIIVARKPLVGTVAENVLKHGTGAINVDGCRVGTDGATKRSGQSDYPKKADGTEDRSESWARTGHCIVEINAGRWPANLIHDGSDEVVRLFPDRDGGAFPATQNTASCMMSSKGKGLSPARAMADSGSAARFFYCAKASKRDRDEGLSEFDYKKMGFSNDAQMHGEGYDKGQDIGLNRVISRKNHHPTVKPTSLMRYLCRLVTPPGGVVLDPFTGSGSTGKAAILEGFDFVGIEQDADYAKIAEARIKHAIRKKSENLPF